MIFRTGTIVFSQKYTTVVLGHIIDIILRYVQFTKK